MHQQLIEKPIIIAICGKSASGKDTLAKFLTNYFTTLGLHAHNMVSVTTRSPRVTERNGIDYYFVNENQFERLIDNQQLIEFTHFKGKHYGVPYNEVKSGYINIGVFNPEGLRTLKRLKYDYWIIPVYLEEPFLTRMRRSYEREGVWKFEFLRRAWADHFDFQNINSLLVRFRGRYIHLKNIDNVWKQANLIERTLYAWEVLIRDNYGVRLGNFV